MPDSKVTDEIAGARPAREGNTGYGPEYVLQSDTFHVSRQIEDTYSPMITVKREEPLTGTELAAIVL